MRDLAGRIEEERLKRGLSARALADAAGLGEGAVLDIVNRRSKAPRVDTVWKIADALGVSIGFLLDEPAAPAAQGDIIEVVGAIALDEWQEDAVWPPGRRYHVAATRSPAHPKARRFGLIVGDGHCDLYYRPGSILLCLPLKDAGQSLKEGDRVIVRLRKSGLVMSLCMTAAPTATGGVALRTAATNPRRRFMAEIERSGRNAHPRAGGTPALVSDRVGGGAAVAGRTGYQLVGEGPRPIAYQPQPADQVTIDALVVGHVE